jgi:ATP-dependent helicase HrpB
MPSTPPENLPIFSIRDTLLSACARTRRIILQAPTGSGKSTQVPQMLLDGNIISANKQIIILQPRRLPTRMLSAHIAAERGQALGGEVGYQIRFDRVDSPATRIKFVTEGLLLRQMLSDPGLEGIGALIFDEFHERNLDSDIALALARHLQETTRPDLLILVMSATLDTDALAKWLHPCETLSVQGRLYPIAITYAPGSIHHNEAAIWERAAQQFQKLYHEEPEGDFLIFMPGAYEIQRTLDAIIATPEGRRCLALPLHGELPPAQQDAAVAPPPNGIRKVVVSTNVAETSLTIDGIRVVIDSGLARVARWDPRRGINTLLIENISQASAEQRAGRAGRTAPGLCARLWGRSDHENRPLRDTPEVRRVELSGHILALIAGHNTDPALFPWFEKPDPRSLEHALTLLRDLGAIADARTLTPIGQRMVAFPLHPRHARMLLAAHEHHCLPALASIAALAQGRDIMLPLTDSRAATAREELLGETSSDFFHRLALLNIAQKNKFDISLCKRLGIHAHAARTASLLAAQFLRIARSQNLDCEDASGGEDAIRICLLTGFSDQLAMRLDKGTLRCALIHSRKGELRRQSAVRHASLFVAAEVDEIETRGEITVFLNMATAIQEEWLAKLFPGDFNERTLIRYDPHLRKCLSRHERRFRDLVLFARETDEIFCDEASRLLACEILDGRLELTRWNSLVEAWINKVNFAAKALPELEISPIDTDARRILLEEICLGSSAWSQVRDRDPWPTLHGWLTPEQSAAMNTLLPDRITLPYKQHSAPIRYTQDEAIVAARLQDLYDTPDSHFRIANGRLHLTIEIQSPARRTFQRTQDLDSFWKISYELLKKELRGRYPKHEWR